MNEPKRRPAPATYADLERVPPEKVAELVDGELIVSPRSFSRHAHATTILGSEIVGPFGKPPGGGAPGGWWLLFEPELHLREHVLVPDMAGWRRERMGRIPDVPFFTLAPDWVCEVTSPSTAGLDRVRKMPIYAREQVGHLWLLNPIDKVLEVFRREGPHWLQIAAFEGAAKIRAEPFDAIEIELARFWLEES